MNLPMASPNENMKIDSSINPTPARGAERSSVDAEIFDSRFIFAGDPHPEERPLGRVSKVEASWFETALMRLLTMRKGARQSGMTSGWIAVSSILRYRCFD